MIDYTELISAGIAMDEFLKRLMGNASLIKIFVSKFTEDQTFASLQSAFQQKDMSKAEISSHTLKGMCGNMSLKALYDLFSQQVNLLRSGECEKAEAMLEEISGAYLDAVHHMRQWLSRQ